MAFDCRKDELEKGTKEFFFLPPPSVAKQFGKGLPWAQRARRNLFLPVHTVWGSNIIVAEWSESNRREKAISLI